MRPRPVGLSVPVSPLAPGEDDAAGTWAAAAAAAAGCCTRSSTVAGTAALADGGGKLYRQRKAMEVKLTTDKNGQMWLVHHSKS